MEPIEQDDGIFMELDGSPVSFNLTGFGLHSARLSALGPTLAAHVQTVVMSTLIL
jgi:hypothetical protein